MKNHLGKLTLLILVLLILLGFGLYHRTYLLMGTFAEITIPEKNDELLEGTVEKMKSLEAMMSIYEKESEVSRINSLGKDKLKKVSPEVYEVIERAIYFGKLTDGAFDITVAPILKLWHFEGGELKEIPSQEKINEALKSVGWQNITLTPEKEVGFTKENMSIDLGGIATGYIVDKGITYLKEKGIKSALINAGGDIYCLGGKNNEEPWSVGIRHPRKKDEIIGTLKFKDKGVTTSGDYEKFFILKGKRFCHIINPQNGYPVDNPVIQVTTVANTCTDADALATALMVMGKEKGLKLIENFPDADAVIIEESGEGKLSINYTSGLEGVIELYE